MPRVRILYIYSFYFECPNPKCQSGLICVFRFVKRRQDKGLQVPQKGRCSACGRSFKFDANKAIRRTVDKWKNKVWSTLLVLDEQGKEVRSSGPSV
jgi:transcription elongation factor Elf1